MPEPLENVTVAITEHRYTKEFSTLFERLGANVLACPLMEEKPIESREELQVFVRQVCSGTFDMMIFLTGIGVRFLVAEAEGLGLRDEFLRALEKSTVVVRGPKPVAALRQFGIRADIVPQVPTTEGVINALSGRDLRGRKVGVQLYGTPNPALLTALETYGAKAVPVQVYAYSAAADPNAVRDFIGKITGGDVQVIAFTSAPQIRMLFDMAAQLGISAALEEVLRQSVVVASIGEVTSRALEEKGLKPRIVPNQPKMAPMAEAIGNFFKR